ncbi:hypothetical protein GCM10025734_15150 [Kitasatospora paranensis]
MARVQQVQGELPVRLGAPGRHGRAAHERVPAAAEDGDGQLQRRARGVREGLDDLVVGPQDPFEHGHQIGVVEDLPGHAAVPDDPGHQFLAGQPVQRRVLDGAGLRPLRGGNHEFDRPGAARGHQPAHELGGQHTAGAVPDHDQRQVEQRPDLRFEVVEQGVAVGEQGLPQPVLPARWPDGAQVGPGRQVVEPRPEGRGAGADVREAEHPQAGVGGGPQPGDPRAVTGRAPAATVVAGFILRAPSSSSRRPAGPE